MTFYGPRDSLDWYKKQLNLLQEAIGQETMVQQAQHLQTFFNQDLWPLISQLELSQHQSQWHAAITEMHRHMRLLSLEISFAKAARQGDTQQQRLAQIEQRLQELRGFTQALLSLLTH
ncbi:MAG: heterocyst frequency control protein PatD [Cyanobacteria bacterium P01_C01_bin.118]